MNYDHAYHAGNFADVLKHTALCLCLDHLGRKDKGYFVLDTHAGQGAYPLDDPRVLKTGEAASGIRRLLAMEEDRSPDGFPAALGRYLEIVRSLGDGRGGGRYPGSPLLCARVMRPQDRLVVCELNPRHLPDLKGLLEGDRRVRVEARDGYEALRAWLPPQERRGLVLIDPPFERTDEFPALVEALRGALKRWQTGTVMIWYPVKDGRAVADFHDAMTRVALGEGGGGAGGRPVLIAGLAVRVAVPGGRMTETGLMVINPPWPLAAGLEAVLPVLATVMGEDSTAGWTLRWLVTEDGGREETREPSSRRTV